jgi:hypothetical protein
MSYDLDTVAKETDAALERIEALRIALVSIAQAENWADRSRAVAWLTAAFVRSVAERDLPMDPSRHILGG